MILLKLKPLLYNIENFNTAEILDQAEDDK